VGPRASLGLVAAGLAACALAQEPSASVVLRWEPVAEAVAYEIQIARDASFAGPVVSERVPAAGYRWRSLPSERHFWRVRSVDVEGRPGPWSAVKAIEPALRPPEPIAPEDGAAVAWDGGGVPLSWRPSAIVREWIVEVARDAAFADPVADRRSTEPGLAVDLPGAGRFHWRVRAVALSGAESAPSAPRSFEARLTPRPPEARPLAAALVEPGPLPAGPAGPGEAALAAGTFVPDLEPAGPGPAGPATDPPPPARGGRLGVGILAGWTTNLASLSAPTVGAEALWRPGPGRLALSLRASWTGESAEIPAQPGLPSALDVRAQVFPFALLALWEWPVRRFVLHGGAGLSAQLVHLSVGGDSALEAAAGVALAAGATRRLGAGEALAEVTYATGSVDGSLGSLRTGGLQLLAGYRFRR
jgi:hypothetical protein